MVGTLANDLIGTGPRLQLLTSDAAANREVERAFRAWSRRVNLAEKLRTMRRARAVDGEAFALRTTNTQLPDVQVDLRLIEADQVASPAATADQLVDGIQLDRNGVPLRYEVLDTHPGDQTGGIPRTRLVSAANVCHLFRVDRPGQARGMSELAPALSLFALLRRYTLAVVRAAETAASISGTLESEAPADDEDAVITEPGDTFELDRGSLLALPAGARMQQVKAEQPTTTYPMFRDALLNEVARALGIPFNVAAGNSGGYNYASGRLDWQIYHRLLGVEREQVECVILDPLLTDWMDEAALTGIAPAAWRSLAEIPHRWMWPGHEHVDPAKEANAQRIRLESRTTTLFTEYAKQGLDWEAELRQIAAEQALMRELGLSSPGTSTTADEPDDTDTDQDDELAESELEEASA